MEVSVIDHLVPMPGGENLPGGNNSLLDDPHLLRIKAQLTSKDPVAVREALLLKAIDTTISEIDPNLPPAAYFGLILTLIEGSIAQDSAKNPEQLLIQLKLLSVVLRKQKSEVFITKVDALAGLLVEILKKYYDDLPVIKMITRCARRILEREELCRWTEKAPRAVLFKNLLLLAMHSEIETISSHLKIFFGNALANLAYSGASNSSFKADLFAWCDNTLSLLEDQLKDVRVSTIPRSFLTTLDMIIGLCTPMQASESYGRIDKRMEMAVRIMRAYYSVSKGNPEKVHAIVLLSRKLVAALDCRNNFAEYPAWCAAIIKSIFIFTMDVIEDTNNPEVLFQSLSVLSQVLSVLHSIHELSHSGKIIGTARLKVFNNVGSTYSDELLNVLDKILCKIHAMSVKRDYRDCSENIMHCVRTISNDCIAPFLEDCSHQKSNELSTIIKKYLLGYTYSSIWGYILDLIPVLLKRVKDSNEVIRLIREVPIFKMFFSSHSDTLEPVRTKMHSCMVFFSGSIGLKPLLDASQPLETSSDEECRSLRLSLFPKLIEIYTQALVKWSKDKTYRHMLSCGTHSLSQAIHVVLPEIDMLNNKLSNAKESMTSEERVELDLMRLGLWRFISKLCSILPVDDSGSLEKLCLAINYAILNNQKMSPFNNSNYSDEYIKEAYRIYCSLVRVYTEIRRDTSPEERIGLDSRYEVMLKGAQEHLPILCNECVDVSATLDTNLHTLPKAALAQKIYGGKNGLLRECVFWVAVVAESERLFDYLMLLLKTVLNYDPQSKGFMSQHVDPKNVKMYLVLGLIEILVKALLYSKAENDNNPNYEIILRMVCDTVLKLLPTYGSIEQKKIYSILRTIVAEFGRIFKSEDFSVLMDPRILGSISKGSKKHRVIILSKLIANVQQSNEEVLLEMCTKFIPEVVLATKDKGTKVKKVAYSELLKVVQHFCCTNIPDNAELSMNRFEKLMYILFAGLALDDVMKAATAVSLIYVVHNFSYLVNDLFLRDLFFTVSEFRRSNSLILLKAYLVFIKMMISSISQERIDLFLEQIIQGLLDVAHKEEHKLRNVVLNIFEKIMRRFSLEALEGFIPQSDSRLLTSIKKRLKSRSKLGDDRTDIDDYSSINNALTIRKSEMTNRTFKTKKHAVRSDVGHKSNKGSKRINGKSSSDSSTANFYPDKKEKTGRTTLLGADSGDAIDLLDIGASGALSEYNRLRNSRLTKKPARKYFEEDSSGKIIITEDPKDSRRNKYLGDDNAVDDTDSEVDLMDCTPSQAVTQNNRAMSLCSRASKIPLRAKSAPRGNIAATESGKSWGYHHNKNTLLKELKKRREISRITGKKYKSRRAKGDVKKKDSMEPYAYISLRSKIVPSLSKILKKQKRQG